MTTLLMLPALCGPSLLKTDPATLLRLLVLAPLLEEWIVRAGLQEWLMRRIAAPGAAPGAGPAAALLAPMAAVLVPAACFSLLHLGAGWFAVATVFPTGLAMGLLYWRWRDWRLCAAAHALCNGFALTFCSMSLQ